MFFMAFGFNFFQSLSVHLKAECNKGYVKVKQVCLLVLDFHYILEDFLMLLTLEYLCQPVRLLCLVEVTVL